MRFNRRWVLLVVVGLIHCGSPTKPTTQPPIQSTNSADFTFADTVKTGNQPFHRLTAPMTGNLTAVVTWAAAQATQTVCAGRADIADAPATCAPAAAGRTSEVAVSVRSGEPYVLYAVPDRLSDAPYTIDVKIR